MEFFKDVIDYEGLYQISNFGNVKSLSRKIKSSRGFRVMRERILKPATDRKGYLAVSLTKNGKSKTIKVHSIVTLCFLGERKNNHQVNHKDGNKQNNHLSNLEYCTRAENIQHAFDNGLITRKKGEEHFRSKLKNEDILKIRKMSKSGFSQRQISKLFSVNHNTIGSVLRGETWVHV